MGTARRLNDPQCHRVYDWEGMWADWNTRACTLKKVRECVNWACGLYDVKPPRVKQHFTKELSYSYDGLISFESTQGLNRSTALHEVAHHICDQIFDVGDEHHSAEWMGIYLWLLVKARIAPPIALFASAKAKGIRWLPLWQVSPKRLARGRLTKKALKAPSR